MCEAMRILMQDEIVDEVREAHKEGRKEGHREGLAQGEIKKARETALVLAKRGVPAPDIAEIVEVSLKLVQEWLAGSVGLAK